MCVFKKGGGGENEERGRKRGTRAVKETETGDENREKATERREL